ncbi:MAG: acyl-CoA dehydrogenase family protein [Myxococcales bacterium]|nr:acyl-CoA dehydrogenase family protein [Myxococcales bacterium]
MDFRLSEDQEALKQGIRSFCEGRISIDQLRELESKPGAFDRALWGEIAEMGIFGLRLPEDRGGVELNVADAVLVFEELGRAIAPGPLIWTHLAAGLVEGADLGDTVVGGLDMTGPSTELIMLEHLESIDTLLLLKPDGIERIDPKAIDATPVEIPLDPFTPVHHAKSLPAGERIADAETAKEWRLVGTALASAQLLGIAESTLEAATDYAKKREQFGRIIGSFQAIKHILADCFVRQEAARAAAYAAGATLDYPEVGNVERAVSAAKVVAGDAAMKNARASIQVHGGMGYTWEVPAHYFLKRVWVLENVFGTIDEHSDQLAELVGATA